LKDHLIADSIEIQPEICVGTPLEEMSLVVEPRVKVDYLRSFAREWVGMCHH
jgi:hypothetical protein